MVSTIPKSQRHTETGYFAISHTGTSDKNTEVQFSKAFNSPPAVVISMSGSAYNRRIAVTNITASKFDIVTALLSNTTATLYGYWIATELD